MDFLRNFFKRKPKEFTDDTPAAKSIRDVAKHLKRMSGKSLAYRSMSVLADVSGLSKVERKEVINRNRDDYYNINKAMAESNFSNVDLSTVKRLRDSALEVKSLSRSGNLVPTQVDPEVNRVFKEKIQAVCNTAARTQREATEAIDKLHERFLVY